jgi:hypothetical protein
MLKISYAKEIQVGETISFDNQIVGQEMLAKNQTILVVDKSGAEFNATITELKADSQNENSTNKAIINYGLFSIEEAARIIKDYKFIEKYASPQQLVSELNQKLIGRVLEVQKSREKQAKFKEEKRTTLEEKRDLLKQTIKASKELKNCLLKLNEQARNKFLSSNNTFINKDILNLCKDLKTVNTWKEGAEFNKQVERKVLPDADAIEDNFINKIFIALKINKDDIFPTDELINKINFYYKEYIENKLVPYTGNLITTLQQFIPFIATLERNLGQVRDSNKLKEESRILRIILRRMYKFYACENLGDTIAIESDVKHISDYESDCGYGYQSELANFICEILNMVHKKTKITLHKKNTIGKYLCDSREIEKKRDKMMFSHTNSNYISDQ